MRRFAVSSSVSVLSGILGLAQLVGCDSSAVDQSSAAQRAGQGDQESKGKSGDHGKSGDDAKKPKPEIVACHLDDGTVGPDDDLRACDPQTTKKTTICHIPPGNPANAHTLCIGNPAVPHHLANHGDYLGPCKPVERPCPPPPPSGMGGSSGGGGTGGSTGEGAGGSGGTGDQVPPAPDGGTLIP